MAVTSGISYPPTMPLYADRIRHARVNEPLWAAPLPFQPFLIMTSIIFLLGLGCMYAINHQMLPLGTLSPKVSLLVISLLPAVLLVLIITLTPKTSSPAYPYQAELFKNPDDERMRWNLAVVSTANIYCGEIAQSEWLGLLPQLAEKDRFRALDYIRLVTRRLQRFPLCTAGEIGAMLIAALSVLFISLVGLHYTWLEAILHGVALLLLVQLFLLYLYMQRWQHTRRLLELEEIFEELLPSQRPAEALPTPVDEVADWYKEQKQQTATPGSVPAKDAPPAYPKAPWE